MLVWVAYDISDNRLRTRIANQCKDFGLVRFQKSIFLGESDRSTLQLLTSSIRREMDGNAGEEDSVVIGTLCGSCQKSVITSGKMINAEKYRRKMFVIIG
ncbi:MAG: CRISPR-associated endonuclease Cas2 [Methanomicrobiales archaeon]|nr:CRISPR-associated endonuclease Cas2 [Methanomicrobiales archaeon]